MSDLRAHLASKAGFMQPIGGAPAVAMAVAVAVAVHWTGRAARRAQLGWVYLFTYVYVVAVNKGLADLCTTVVYIVESKRWRIHNRMRSVCGTRPFRSITFEGIRALDELSRLRPHRLHTNRTAHSPAYPQLAVDNSSAACADHRSVSIGAPPSSIRSMRLRQDDRSLPQCTH